MRAVIVSREEAEKVRQKLLFEGALDKTRRLVKKSGLIEIPVKESFAKEGLTLVEQEEPRFYIPKKTPGDYLDILDIPDSERELLPAGWQILGDIIIVSLHEKLENQKAEIGKALLSLYPGCRTVLLDRGISGQMRQPEREVIAGRSTETIHIENGCSFKIDAMKLMYSKGNLAERKRMSGLGEGETVVDMFAGIGYFSIPMAVHSKPKKIFAIEINPVASGYLKENIKLNRVEDVIEPVEGDCAVVTPHGIADRVIMGYLDAHEYLKHGIRALSPGGIIHYHEAVPEAIERRPVERISAEAEKQGRDAKIINMRRIKKYSPGVWHVVVDARVD
ncbi:putative methyltransferase [Candidatus Methanoperedens nitroreducens]|uniref:tRNA(Phe) (4-demethylwyosine(37)-C(7)) aminocarboxypropyltransferase n=1 Tax=Candidatus Methanoperedens nitratireducens TaxID=1392998 RepID=A0A062UZH8_9EURY|nr:class I SAM-dependent methyltransferase family protein [Candidatus Methanoperedens nitroreducens]KCZ72331.1 putative methyltransferase [Candidatus Methanoperedens nitroreducens]MDJ1423735.1 class I SAM-dependent methyltransferase family protein [Candidatus Methanoperedens sp.]